MAGSTTIPTASESVRAYSCFSGDEVAYSENGTARQSDKGQVNDVELRKVAYQ